MRTICTAIVAGYCFHRRRRAHLCFYFWLAWSFFGRSSRLAPLDEFGSKSSWGEMAYGWTAVCPELLGGLLSAFGQIVCKRSFFVSRVTLKPIRLFFTSSVDIYWVLNIASSTMPRYRRPYAMAYWRCCHGECRLSTVSIFLLTGVLGRA